MFKNILVAVDLEDDDQNDELLRAASQVAAIDGAKVNLLNVIAAAPAVVSRFLPESYEEMAFENIEKELTARATKFKLAEGAPTVSVRFGNVYQEILAHANKIGADLIIVASHKSNVGEYLLGTTAARIVRHATCSTLVIRQTE